MQMLHVDSFVFHYLGAIEYSIYNHNTHHASIASYSNIMWCAFIFSFLLFFFAFTEQEVV